MTQTMCVLLTSFLLSGCSVFGNSSVDIAPYTVLKKSEQFELRHYDELILVSTPMQGMGEQGSSFGKLFDYISGENQKTQKIPMTAPVFLDQTSAKSDTMAFVLPTNYSIESAPIPSNPSVKLKHLTNYTVAAITFSGRLKQASIEKNKQQLLAWIKDNNLKIIGTAKAAGYNPPFTLPPFRRNEVMIPVEKL